MDEGTLNDLLECSVCLERLDTSSKVLPCQHTFCRKCLEEIVQKHKELRCPECRVLVQIRVENLPPNVLLMRLLEGMRNAVPKRAQQRTPPKGVVHPNVVQLPNVVPILPSQEHGTPDHKSNHVKKALGAIVHHQPYAKALYDYLAKEPGDLTFKRGDVIILRKRIDSNWFQGEANGKQGVFPLSYVQVITPVPSNLPQCKALYDFRMSNDEEEGCLAFSKGDIINVIRRVDENWAEGKLEGKIGIFPLAFVELNNLARSLMKLSTNSQPGPSKLAPPTPTSEDSTPLIPTDHSRTVLTGPSARATTEGAGVPTSDSSSTLSSGGSSSTTPNATSSNTSSSSSTGPSSPASPPLRGQPTPPKCIAQKPEIHHRSPNTHLHAQHVKEKRHSFTGLSNVLPHSGATSHHRYSDEILLDSPQHTRRVGSVAAPETTLPTAYIALYPYKPHKSDELELKKGDIYMVSERCQDGWFKGTSNRTQKCGVFPGNYVALARGGVPPTSGSSSDAKSTVSSSKAGKSVSASKSVNIAPPELPPRASSPAALFTASWHGGQSDARSAVLPALQLTPNVATKCAEKLKERKEKGTSLMRRLTSIKSPKSNASGYSMDNPVFEDISSSKSPQIHPVHVRSGSCPSQLLQLQPTEHHRLFGSTSQRYKIKERPSIIAHNRPMDNAPGSSNSSPEVHRHRKSNSLDAGNATKSKNSSSSTQNVRERFRCIAPYPPNSEYELELHVNDIIYVHKKREDGWYKGTQQRTGKTGLFPASFVENI